MNRLLIIGGNALGEQIAHYASMTGKYEVVGYLDDSSSPQGVEAKIPVIGKIAEVSVLFKKGTFDQVFIALGYNRFKLKEEVYNSLKASNIPLATIISPNVYIDPTAKIGEGCCFYPGVTVEMEAEIADDVIMNASSTVAHNSYVGAHTFIAGGAILAGRVTVGQRCFIGVNSTINDSCKVGDDIIVGSATVIRKSIKKTGLYVTKEKNLFFEASSLAF